MEKINEYLQENLKFIEILNDNGMKVTLCDLGASIYNIYINGDIVTLTPKHISDFSRGDLYYGKNIGPICSRIRNGEIVIGDNHYFLECNSANNTFALHSGKRGFSTMHYDYKIKENIDNFEVIFEKKIEDFAKNFKGFANLKFTYIIYKKNNKIELDTYLTCDKDFIFSITNHAYFNLGEKHIKDLNLFIDSSNHVLLDKIYSLPIKEEPVNSIINFRKSKNLWVDYNEPYLQDCAAKGYDHNYILKNPTIENISCSLIGKKHQLDIYTTFPGLQIYTCNYDDDIEFIDSEKGTNRGIALEPQIPLSRRTILKKSTPFSYKTIYIFK